MKRIPTFVLVVLASVAVACGGGGGGSTGGVVGPSGGPLSATFIPDQPSPGNQTVAMAAGSASGDAFTVLVNVTGVSDVYGAAFDVDFNPSYVDYVGYSAGSLLEQGGVVVNYTVASPQAGSVVVGASRTGNVPGVDVTTSQTLVRLTFRVKTQGSFPLTFGNAALLDSGVHPVAGLIWYGGSLKGI